MVVVTKSSLMVLSSIKPQLLLALKLKCYCLQQIKLTKKLPII